MSTDQNYDAQASSQNPIVPTIVSVDEFIRLHDELLGLPALATTPLLTRIAAVRALVMQHVKYNEDDDVWLSRPLRDTYRNVHEGNAADVNLLLVAALRAAHIDANPLLLSTRENGTIDTRFPRRGAYNYALAHVQLADGQDLLLDATDPSLPCGLVPGRCLNGIGRLLPPAPKAARWVNLQPAQRLTHLRQLQLSLSSAGELRGTMHEEYGGYAAARQRTALAQQGEASYCRSLATEHSDWNLTSIAIGARTEPEKPLALDYQVATSVRSSPGGTHYLSPLAEFGLGHNPFTASTRRYPVDFGMAQEETQLVTLRLPPGYVLATLPDPKIVDLPDNGGRFVCNASSADGVVQLSSRLVLPSLGPRNLMPSSTRTCVSRILLWPAACIHSHPHRSHRARMCQPRFRSCRTCASRKTLLWRCGRQAPPPQR